MFLWPFSFLGHPLAQSGEIKGVVCDVAVLANTDHDVVAWITSEGRHDPVAVAPVVSNMPTIPAKPAHPPMALPHTIGVRLPFGRAK